MVNNLAALKEVLQTKCYSFIKPAYYERVVAEIAGRGILFTEGDEHKKQRKLLVGECVLREEDFGSSIEISLLTLVLLPAPFSFGNIKRLLPSFQEKAQEACSIIQTKLGSEKSGVVEGTNLL